MLNSICQEVSALNQHIQYAKRQNQHVVMCRFDKHSVVSQLTIHSLKLIAHHFSCVFY